MPVPAMGLFHRRQLLGAGGALIGRLPGLVRHAVDGLAALVPAHDRTLGVGGFLEPVRQAVAAEPRQIHQVDVLDVGAGAQMFDKAPEDGGLEFRSGFVVNRNGLNSRRFLQDMTTKWALSQIMPYRSANRASAGGISAGPCLKIPAWPLTVPAGSREIVNDLI